LAPDQTHQHIQKQLASFTRISTQITNTLTEFRTKSYGKHVLNLYSYIELTVQEFVNYYDDLHNEQNPVLHYSHYTYTSPYFQTIFDIIFQPDVITIVQKYYLKTLKCSDLCNSFTPSTLDLPKLSKQLFPYVSNTTLKPILHTLYCFSYFSFICTKPTAASQPLHTYCTQNPLLSFRCIYEFSHMESIRSDPDLMAELLADRISSNLTSDPHDI